MLKSVSVWNFKRFEHAELPLAELTVLVGANASGKSNLLEALQLLSWLAGGLRLDALLVAMEKREMSMRGAPNDLIRAAGPLRLACPTGDDSGRDLQWKVAIEVTSDGFRIAEESLSRQDAKVPLYQVVTSLSGIESSFAPAARNSQTGSHNGAGSAIYRSRRTGTTSVS